MIQSFADPEAELIWSGRRSRRLPTDIQNVVLRKLRLLNRAQVLADLRVPPGNRLEALKAAFLRSVVVDDLETRASSTTDIQRAYS